MHALSFSQVPVEHHIEMEKMPARSLIITSFLLWFSFATTKTLSLQVASEGEEPVNDVNGEPLVPGEEYYIMSAVWGEGGGGVKPEKTGEYSCSYSVVQESSDLNKGAKVKFHLLEGTSKAEEKIIYPASTELEIEFVEKPVCAESSKWVVAYGSSSSKLVIGGPEDHPESELVSGVFKIEVFNAIAYKLVFCPKSNNNDDDGTVGSGSCYDVGVDYKKEGERNLVVEKKNSGNVFMVAFLEAEKGKFSII